jgi:hypothetical protein
MHRHRRPTHRTERGAPLPVGGVDCCAKSLTYRQMQLARPQRHGPILARPGLLQQAAAHGTGRRNRPEAPERRAGALPAVNYVRRCWELAGTVV